MTIRVIFILLSLWIISFIVFLYNVDSEKNDSVGF